jgi:hypothetical protein
MGSKRFDVPTGTSSGLILLSMIEGLPESKALFKTSLISVGLSKVCP